VYASVDALLADPLIDAVYIATTPDSHAALTEQAAIAGKHVLCEKPMAMSVVECEHMVRVCQQNEVSLTIAFYRRYFPVVQKMKSLVESAVIGRPLRIAATTISQFYSSDPNPWRLDASIAGGGFLMDMGTHRFDLFAYFFGQPKQVRGTVCRPTLAGSVDDSASVAIEFDEGVQGSAAFHWNCPIGRDNLEIVGTEGILSTDSLSSEGRLVLETKFGYEHWNLPASSPVHLNLVERTVAHLLDGTPNPVSGESGMIASQIASGVYASANGES
jgi:predicted dehydrogenase